MANSIRPKDAARYATASEEAEKIYMEISAGNAISRQSPFDGLAQALDNLRNARDQVARLSDHLVGSEPQEDGKAHPVPVRVGLIGSLEDTVDAINEMANHINDHVHRIERRL